MASEGNPFYVEELVNWFLEAGVIATDGGRWQVLDERLEEAKVPATLRSVLQARLDGVAGRRAAGAAAGVGDRSRVLGRRRRVAAARRRPSVDRTGGLDHGERSTGCAAERSCTSASSRRSTTTAEFLFKHALLRDVAYEGMLRRHRRNYHGLAARWFEKMAESSHRTDEYAGMIADHHASSGDREAAARWYLVAGQQAASVHALADARRLLGLGIELAPSRQHRSASTSCSHARRCSTGSATAPRSRPICPSSTRSRRPSPRTTRNGASGCC